MHAHRTLLAVLTLPLLAVAQRTVIVDAASGIGTNHLDLPAAFADLQANDVIIVRAGMYTGASVTTAHSFTMIGEGLPVVNPASFLPTVRLTLTGLITQRVTVRGIEFRSTQGGQWALHCRSFRPDWPAPTLHLEDCVVVSQSPSSDRLGLLAEQLGLTVSRCHLSGSAVRKSAAVFTDSTLLGHDAIPSPNRAQNALDVQSSEVWFVRSTITSGVSGTHNSVPAPSVAIVDNLAWTASILHIANGCTLTADPMPHSVWPVPSVIENYAPLHATPPTVNYEANTSFFLSPLGATFASPITTVQTTIANLLTTTAPLGGTLTLDVYGVLGHIGIGAASLSTMPVAGFGVPVFADLSTLVVLGASVLNGPATFTIQVPNNSSLIGTVIEGIGATLDPVSGQLQLTNPTAALVY